LCTQSKNNGRNIDRSEYANVVEENSRRVLENPDYYRKRQQITEHMFGTLKRQRGFTFTLVRGKENVLGEVGLMFIGYNLSRCISVVGAEKLIKVLKQYCLPIIFAAIHALCGQIKELIYQIPKTVPGLQKTESVSMASIYHSKKLYLYVN
jgi:hypothetical protein